MQLAEFHQLARVCSKSAPNSVCAEAVVKGRCPTPDHVHVMLLRNKRCLPDIFA
jgi:hypothetical protein